MKKILLVIVLLYTYTTTAQLANDAVNALVTCSSTEYDFTFDGPGMTDVFSNTCSSGENNSVWLLVTPVTSGTLGFTLTPNSADINIDFDFFVFGPNVTPANLGNAIRCSTTNPAAANQGNNLTGMEDTASNQTSEGPGADGDSFVEWLDVTAGDSYYIMIDKPPVTTSSSLFSIEWTGTATFADPPSNQLPAGTSLSYEDCDMDGDGMAFFDLDQDQAQMVGTQNVTVAYFETLNDAQLNIDDISPSNYESGTGTVYVRLTDTVTSCFSIFDINLNIADPININQPSNLYECDASGMAMFNLLEQDDIIINGFPNMVVSYYESATDAMNEMDPLDPDYTNANATETIWFRLENTVTGCYDIGSFQVEVSPTTFPNPEPNFGDTNLLYCQDDYPQTIPLTVELDNNNINDFTFLWSTGATSQTININLEGDYTVNVINAQGCEAIKTFFVEGSSVFNSTEPNFQDETVHYCVDTFPDAIPLDVGIENNNLTDFTYLWSTGETSSSININEVGNYTVSVFNSDGCSVERTISVLPSEMATFQNTLITNTIHDGIMSIEVQVIGQGDYIYALDLEFGQIHDETFYQEESTFDSVPIGMHILYVLDRNGCSVLIKEIVILDYPKFITPNNDGFYDTWNLDNINAVSNNFSTFSDIVIFDRHGKVIAKIDPQGDGWDGNFLGEPAPPSDYWFTVELIDFNGRKSTKKGHFSLRR